MLGDSQRYEGKRMEMETWLTRMENRCERMGVVATTADVLEAQQKEQKTFHAELHQYKHQIELFNALTQKLIAVYPSDDTTRIKRMTETVNQRYTNLNSAVINRGKQLHTAVHNLQSFDKAMDQDESKIRRTQKGELLIQLKSSKHPTSWKALEHLLRENAKVKFLTSVTTIDEITTPEDVVTAIKQCEISNISLEDIIEEGLWNHANCIYQNIRNECEEATGQVRTQGGMVHLSL
ncbi:hypothetical protein ACFFRR_000154 [Megaselia abdita]